MFNWHQFPWTNFNELNLDWIMKRLKELSVKVPELEDKVDNVFQFIEDNIGNLVTEQVAEQLPQILDDITLVWHDVTVFGAVGDGVTDDTDAIKAALDAGECIYFPPGQYLFKEIDVYHPVFILGAGEDSILTPIRKFATTNQFYTMFNFHDDTIIKDIKLWADNSVAVQSGTQMYNDAAFVADGIERIRLEGVIFEHIYETYHLSVADLDFPNRHGMAVYFHNCGLVEFVGCEFGDYGGEELVQIVRDRGNAASTGFVLIDGCYFHDRSNGDHGSCINTLGGTCIFVNNNVYNFHNVYSDGVTGGTLFNLCSINTIMANNVFKDCMCGNYVDFCEGYYTKSDIVICCDNIFDGQQKAPIHIGARRAWFKNNYLRGALGLRTFTMTEAPAATLQYGGPYGANAATLYTYQDLYIEGNNFHIIKTPFGLDQAASYDTTLGLGQHPAGQDPVQSKVMITGNAFERDADAVTKNTIFLAQKIGRCFINDNIFRLTGESYPDLSGAVCYISGVDAVSYLNIIGNTFDCSYKFDVDTYLVSGSSDFRSNSYYLIANNVAVISHSTGSPGTVYAASGSPAHIQTENNLNITV